MRKCVPVGQDAACVRLTSILYLVLERTVGGVQGSTASARTRVPSLSITLFMMHKSNVATVDFEKTVSSKAVVSALSSSTKYITQYSTRVPMSRQDRRQD